MSLITLDQLDIHDIHHIMFSRIERECVENGKIVGDISKEIINEIIKHILSRSKFKLLLLNRIRGVATLIDKLIISTTT